MGEDLEVVFEGYFKYGDSGFLVEDMPLKELVAKHGTPCYVYSKGYINNRIDRLKSAFSGMDTLICYSVKANSNLSILSIMKDNGFGADVVSGGELRRALAVGFSPEKIVFAGVGKKEDEISLGISRDIGFFNVENEEEFDIIQKYAKCANKKVLCNMRLNLDIDVDTHHYVKTSKKETKFGLDTESAERILSDWGRRGGNLSLKGVHLHIGSQIKTVAPYIHALEKLEKFIEKTGFTPEIIDMGGGFGIAYSAEDRVCDIEQFGHDISARAGGLGVKKLIIEPGRYVMGNSAVLAARVLYVKKRGHKNFVIVDAGMNDLIRPSLYGSSHLIMHEKGCGAGKQERFDIVGPICETGDYLGQDVLLPEDVRRGDIIVVASAGAYAFSMASNYNSRPRPCEIIIEKDNDIVIRRREACVDLWKHEI